MAHQWDITTHFPALETLKVSRSTLRFSMSIWRFCMSHIALRHVRIAFSYGNMANPNVNLQFR